MVVTRRSRRSSPSSALKRVRAWLDRAHLVDGRVPPERELAPELGLARSALRQALAALEAEGVLDRHVGRGTFLVGPPRAGGTTSPGETMQVRAVLEPSIVPLVIEAATRRDFERLDDCLRHGEAAPSVEGFERWDAALHRSIVAAAHNDLLDRLYSAVQAARADPAWGRLKRQIFTAERRAAYEADHRRIVAALKNRDTGAAQAALRAHLGRVRADLFGDPAG